MSIKGPAPLPVQLSWPEMQKRSLRDVFDIEELAGNLSDNLDSGFRAEFSKAIVEITDLGSAGKYRLVLQNYVTTQKQHGRLRDISDGVDNIEGVLKWAISQPTCPTMGQVAAKMTKCLPGLQDDLLTALQSAKAKSK